MAVLIGVVVFCYYSYYYFEHMMTNVHTVYAHLGHPEAQHRLAQRYLQGYQQLDQTLYSVKN